MTLLKNKAFIISMILWCFVTVVRILNHIPWFDEAHAWTISKELNLFQIIDLMKIEGHTIIWYVLLMPFAKLNIAYPYSMQFLNWIFCFLSLIILWKKAPFPTYLKILITFSVPFLTVYSVFARCYSVGIMLLFLLTAYFKEKLKHPVFYSILLALCANTSVMALFGATAFGIVFLHEIFKTKTFGKNLILPAIILLLGGSLVLISLLGSDSTVINNYKGKFIASSFSTVFQGVFSIIICSLVVGILVLFKKSKTSSFFYIFNLICLIACFTLFYSGHFWNHYFLYIYLIVSSWMACFDEKVSSKAKKHGIILLSILTLFNYFNFDKDFSKLNREIFGYENQNIYAFTINNENFKKYPLIVDNMDFLGYIIKPYRINAVNYCADKGFDYDVTNYPAENQFCYTSFKDQYNILIDKERLDGLLNNDKSFLYSEIEQNLFDKNGELKFSTQGGNEYKIKKYKCFPYIKRERCFYEIDTIKKR